jgi:uncharacterized membrane protein
LSSALQGFVHHIAYGILLIHLFCFHRVLLDPFHQFFLAEIDGLTVWFVMGNGKSACQFVILTVVYHGDTDRLEAVPWC